MARQKNKYMYVFGLPLLKSSFNPAYIMGGIGLGAALTLLALDIYQADAIPAILFYWFLATVASDNFQIGFGLGIYLGTLCHIGYVSINYPSSVFVANTSPGILISLLIALAVVIYATIWLMLGMKRLAIRMKQLAIRIHKEGVRFN